MDKIEDILKNTTEENQHKVDWTAAWSGKYPVLKTYQSEVDIPAYSGEIRRPLSKKLESGLFLDNNPINHLLCKWIPNRLKP